MLALCEKNGGKTTKTIYEYGDNTKEIECWIKDVQYRVSLRDENLSIYPYVPKKKTDLSNIDELIIDLNKTKH